MNELKPCPFCGESKLLYSGGCGFRYDDDDNQIRLFRVHCRTCKGRTGLFESLDEAVEAWNRRTNSTTIQPSALSTNLAEVSTDCISRQALLDKFEPWLKVKDYNDGELNMLKAVLYEIRFMPPAQPKRGKWHYSDGKPATIGRSFGVICDQCGTESEYCTNFCGECGADMREVTNE